MQGNQNLFETFRSEPEARDQEPNTAEAFLGGVFQHLQSLVYTALSGLHAPQLVYQRCVHRCFTPWAALQAACALEPICLPALSSGMA